MKIFKKLLATVLSLFMIFNLMSISLTFAEDYCDSNRNSKGGYIDYICAELELSKVFDGKANFTVVENIGFLADEERGCFNLRALDEVFERYKLVSIKELENRYESLDKAYNASFFNLKNLFISGIIGFIAGCLNLKSSKSNLKLDEQVLISEQTAHPPIRNSSSKPFRFGLFAGLASLAGLFINDFRNKKNIKKDIREVIDKKADINQSNHRKAGILNRLLWTLDKTYYYDMFCYISGVGEDEAPIRGWAPSHAEANYYTEAEKNSFPEKIKEITTKIRNHLKEYDELESDNELNPDNSIYEEGCPNCEQIGN